MLSVTDFNSILSSCIDDTISEILSIRAMESIYTYLRKQHSIERDQVPYRLDTVCSLAANLLGAKVAHVIGKSVARKLYSRLELNFHDRTNYKLSDYVEEAKKSLEVTPVP